ncbi:hypothetical protein MED92_15598 [Oceanospirillum sp. MED92]|uniref:Uncharacterized protein n=2 Tax=Neptuniibacter caesariensis TaxID=207954 RepID=A0A7U8C6H4_NEPCE|nr:hypothetical protein MED92_15598 [Oceanospirillum sp. MED92] [Neptuniibacter caesariensis]
MQMEMNTRTIAILEIDGESYQVDGCYQGQQRKAQWYNVVKSSDRSVQVEHLDEFPSHQQIRDLLN